MVKKVVKVVYLIQEVSRQKCVPGLLVGRGHWCMAIDRVETSQAFKSASMSERQFIVENSTTFA